MHSCGSTAIDLKGWSWPNFWANSAALSLVAEAGAEVLVLLRHHEEVCDGVLEVPALVGVRRMGEHRVGADTWGDNSHLAKGPGCQNQGVPKGFPMGYTGS